MPFTKICKGHVEIVNENRIYLLNSKRSLCRENRWGIGSMKLSTVYKHRDQGSEYGQEEEVY